MQNQLEVLSRWLSSEAQATSRDTQRSWTQKYIPEGSFARSQIGWGIKKEPSSPPPTPVLHPLFQLQWQQSAKLLVAKIFPPLHA